MYNKVHDKYMGRSKHAGVINLKVLAIKISGYPFITVVMYTMVDRFPRSRFIPLKSKERDAQI